MRSIFCASPGNRNDHKNCLRKKNETNKINQVIKKKIARRKEKQSFIKREEVHLQIKTAVRRFVPQKTKTVRDDGKIIFRKKEKMKIFSEAKNV